MLEYNVLNSPHWLFSTMLNTAMNSNTHTPNSHLWKPLPWFWLLRGRPWKLIATSGATVEWQLEWHCSNIRSNGRVIWSHRLSYNRSMLKYKVIKFAPWMFSTKSNTAMSRKTHPPDSHRWQPLPWFCLLRRQLWKSKSSDSCSDSGATAGVLVE